MDRDECLKRLYHVDIPLLEDYGIIDYDDPSETIRYHDCELVADVLAAINRTEPTQES